MTASPSPETVAAALDRACRRIPPLWPLSATVAVNPFLGQTEETLAAAAARLARVAGAPVTLPRTWYRDRIAAGEIAEIDLAAALAACREPARPASTAALRAALETEAPRPQALPTLADLAARSTGTDWPDLVAERIGHFAGSLFDRGQALWQVEGRAWTLWRVEATRDLTPEIHGATGFAARVAALPIEPEAAVAATVARLGLPDTALECYFHRLLMTLGGWAQYARHLLWKAELGGGSDPTLADLLAIRLVWEEALHDLAGEAGAAGWAEIRARYAEPVTPSAAETVDAIFQDAAERAAQRGLAETLATPVESTAPDRGTPERATPERPTLQAAFCIDVRSEIFRRALEAVDPSIRTLGFAGFFGIGARHRRFASDVAEHRLPVLLTASVESTAETPDRAETALAARHSARALRAWGRFKLAAVSSFAFVEAMGPVYVAKLVRDALGLGEMPAPSEPAPRFAPALPLETRIGAAETVLRAMSLTCGFARLVVLAGHGARVTNNPFESGLQCGACGGYSGEANARLLAGLLNDPEVRSGLAPRGIEIPGDTLFVGGLHDTTSDRMTLYIDAPAEGHRDDIARARRWFEAAGRATRGERAPRLPRASGAHAVDARARDWAEVRPEWALAGAQAFIAAPRSRTRGRSLEGRAFLHDYVAADDAANGYPVLELIMTAPVVVASWISLQYYGSVVAPEVFGSGNKLLHNVVGGIGVVEGNGGTLRGGLPWQSVHDGERLMHEPLRLTVCIEAPVDAMTEILARHDGVRALFDNGWLGLFALDGEGRMAHRYAGGLVWEPMAEPAAKVA